MANYGVVLVAVGLGMFIAELFLPTYGSVGFGGLIAFTVGALILIDLGLVGPSIGVPLVAAVVAVGAVVLVGVVFLGLRAMRRPVVTGVQSMVGEHVQVFEDFDRRGRVRYGGELWNARSNEALHAGQMARIVKVEGLILWVEPV